MHGIGERVLYGANGVMEIVDIREETIADVAKKYYVLRDLNSVTGSQTFVPIDNQKLVSAMRPILTKNEAMDMIRRIRTIPEAEWKNDNRVRSEKFRSIIESGDRDGMISVIKAVYENRLKRQEVGKKNYLADESLLKKAEKVLYAELSLVLEIPESEVAEFISRNC